MVSPANQALAETFEVGEPPEPEERHAFARSSVWISGQLIAGDETVPCDLLNVSSGGVRIRCALPDCGDAALKLDVDGHAGIAVAEAWRDGDLLGLRFDAPPDAIARFLESVETAEPSIMEQRRYRRCSVMWSACVFSGGRTMDAVVLNLCAGGARVRLAESTVLDDRATLSIGRFGDFPGRLVWRDGNEFGLAFLDPPARIVSMVGDTLPRIREDFRRANEGSE